MISSEIASKWIVLACIPSLQSIHAVRYHPLGLEDSKRCSSVREWTQVGTVNYRPISRTCVVFRMMERILKQKILLHLKTNKFISPSQHGFLPKKFNVH